MSLCILNAYDSGRPSGMAFSCHTDLALNCLVPVASGADREGEVVETPARALDPHPKGGENERGHSKHKKTVKKKEESHHYHSVPRKNSLIMIMQFFSICI